MTLTGKRLWLLSILSLFACDRAGQPNAEWSGTVRDSSGIEIVDNPAFGTWTDETAWRVEEDLRIGTVEDDPSHQFGDIVGIGVAPDGNIVVLDEQADRPLRVFDTEGTLLTWAGGMGSGPGEFASGAGSILNAGDSLLVVPDNNNSRVNVFDIHGEFRYSVPVALTELINRYGVTSDGVPVLQVGLSMMPGMESRDDLVDVLLWVGPDGSSRDTLLVFPSGRRFFFEGGMPELTFFAPEPYWTLMDNDAIVLGTNNEYSIGFYFDGNLQRIVRRDFAPVSLSAQDRDVVLDSWIRVFSERIPNAEVTLRQLAQFYDVLPAYERFATCEGGFLWVQRIQTPSELPATEQAEYDPTKGWGSRLWDVFDPDGRYLGQVEFPHRFELFVLRRDFVVGVWRDELDVQYVMRVRIER